MLHFDYAPYPLWRRRLPPPLAAALRPLFRRVLAADADLTPPQDAAAMVAYLARWGLLGGLSQAAAAARLAEASTPTESLALAGGFSLRPKTPQTATPDSAPLRLPAQWEPLETVLLAWPSAYPPLWAQHAAMIEAIAPAAPPTVLVGSPWWWAAARLFLAGRGRIDPDVVRFVVLPTDDIWVRDYGPVAGLGPGGERVHVNLLYAPLPAYPQEQDDAMPGRWAALRGEPLRALPLYLEGGNLWSDGRGTLLLSEQVFHANPGLTPSALRQTLAEVFGARKVILTPRLEGEETGHIDLLVKLADARTVLVSRPNGPFNRAALLRTAALFRRVTNAAGEPYRVFELPTPPLYLNWLVYPIWRSYTNALTVNGRVLVPVYGAPQDTEALAVYRSAMPDYEIVPIDCAASINGGGGVHCLTKEIPSGL